MATIPTLHLAPELRKLKIQCRPGENVDLPALGHVIGTVPPSSPAQEAGAEPLVFWTAPWEWLVVSPALDLVGMKKALADVLAGTVHALTDLSDALAVLEVRGPGAAELLSEGCSVDFGRMEPGHYALTRLEQLAVVIHLASTEPAYRVYVDGSASGYLWEWLEDGLALRK